MTASQPESIRLLRQIHLMLAREGAWCQGADARNADGQPVSPEQRSACSFCLFGAFSHAAVLLDTPKGAWSLAGDMVYEQIEGISGCFSMVGYNDRPGRTKADVLALIDRAVDHVLANARSSS